jgi:type I restriction enzyme S subunit
MKWPSRPVSELCTLAVDCVNKTAPTVDYETPFKMIRTTNVKEGFIYLDDVNYVTEEVFEKWTRRSRPQYGDVILTREAPVGQVGRFTSNEDTVFLGQRLFHYRPNPDFFDWNYLAFVLQSHEVQGRLRGMGFGATVEHIKVGDAEHLQIPCPPIEIQRRIGDILSAYDDLIENNRQRMTLLEETAQQLYREWFVRLRFPGHEHTHITHGVPEGWERKSIAELTIFVNRGIAPHYDNDAKGLVINQKCIRNGRLDLTLARHQSREFKPDRQVQPGDVLVNSTGEGTLGRVAQVISPIPNCTVDTHVTIVRPKADLGRHYFGMAIMDWEPRFSTMGRGATNQTELSRGQIGEATILAPSHSLVQQFEEFAAPLFGQVAVLMEQTQKLRAARDLLLPRLMSGEISV